MIVLAEDNPADVFLFEYALKSHDVDYELVVCRDGHEAMAYVEGAHAGSNPMPQLFVLDLNLPIYTGFDVLKKIRESSRLQGCRAVILTTSDGPRDREEAASLGITMYLQKPTNLDDFTELGAPFKKLLSSAD